MPPVLIPFIAAMLPTLGPVALAGAGAGFGAATWTIATVLAYSVTTAATLGVSLLLGQNQKKQRGDPQQVTVKQSLPARTRSYGRVKISGALAFVETNIGAMYQVVEHGQGPWDGIEEWWLNDKNAQLSGGAVSVWPWGSNITIESYLGTDDQAASALLINNFSPNWTADHRLRGLAYSVIRYGWIQEKYFTKVYPNGAPGLRVVARTAKVLDPRTGVVAFSENPALCIMDFLTHRDGFNIPLALVDQASFAAFAAICDQPMALVGGGSEPRYRVSLTYDLTQEPREVLRLLLQSCDAEIYPAPDGKVAIRGGSWAAPTVTLNADHILGYQYEQGNARLSAFNRLKLTFTDRSADYQPVEIEPWEDLASQAEVGVLQQDLSLTQVPSYTQARRLGKIAMAKGNPRHRLTLRTNLAGLVALGERTVRVDIAELGLNEPFLIERFEIAGDLTGCDMTLSSLPEEAYLWNPVTEEGLPPTAPPDTSTGTVIPKPTGLTLNLVRTQAQLGISLAKIRATVDPLDADPGATPWETIGRYRKTGSADWIAMLDDGDWAVITDVLDDGGSYEVQAAHSGHGGVSGGAVSDWTDSVTITTVADSTAPDSPSGLGVNPSGGSALVSWFAPTSDNYFFSVAYRTIGPVFTGEIPVGTIYGAPGQLQSVADAPGAPGTYYWWVVALNRSGVASPPVGPVSGLIT